MISKWKTAGEERGRKEERKEWRLRGGSSRVGCARHTDWGRGERRRKAGTIAILVFFMRKETIQKIFVVT